jgi:ABC-type polysaccharide/polyol phosphate export permease
MAFHFAWGDTKARYRRSVLGPFWIVLGTAIGVVGLGYLWSEILKAERAVLLPSLAIGLVVWQLIAGTIVDSPNTFVRNAQTIRNIKAPFLVYPLQMILRQLINFGHNFVVVAAVMLIYVRDWSWVQFLFIPGLILVSVNLMWISIVLAIFGARFRDLDPLVAAVMPILFFLSPVIYRPEHLPFTSWVILGNPIAYFIRAIRDPLQGVAPPAYIYVALAALACIGWLAALRLLDHRYARIAFWV